MPNPLVIVLYRERKRERERERERERRVRFARAVSKRSSPSLVRLFSPPPSPSSAPRVRAQWSRKNGLFALKSEAKIFQSDGKERSPPKATPSASVRPSFFPSFRCALAIASRLNVNDLIEVARSSLSSSPNWRGLSETFNQPGGDLCITVPDSCRYLVK